MLLLLACTSSSIKTDSVPPDVRDTEQDSLPTVTDTHTYDSAETGGDTGGDTGSYDADGCSDLYDPEVVQEFSIDIEDADWSALQADYASGAKNYHPIVLHYGDEEVDDAMIRLKGNPYFSWYDEKMQFVIAFNEVDPAARFHGQRKISLDATWYEPTYLRDRIAWSVMRGQGALPFACANGATLTVNGEFYGAYTNIEYFDHEWLERSFGDDGATGTLWKYGSDPVSNAEASDGSAIAAMSATTDPAVLVTLGDLDEWVTEFAAEAVLGDDDGYWCCNHNYYLYEHPTRGILFVPWDFDDDFDVQGYDADPVRGYPNNMGLFAQPLVLALTADPTWGPRFVDAVDSMNAAMDPDVTIAQIDDWEAQLSDAVEADPHRSIGWEEHVAAVERMRAWVRARHAFLSSWVACRRGSTADLDGDGSPVCEDPNDTDATVHPGAPEICDGVDQDADGWLDDPTDTPSGCDDCVRHDFGARHFLLCRNPRTNHDADVNCTSRGGALTGPVTTGEYYFYFFYTWPVMENWWTDAGSGLCGTWDEASFGSSLANCAEAHPSVCGIP